MKVLKDDAVLLYYACKHPRTPFYIKGLLAVLGVYVFSPLDLLPDYLPLIGVLDDVTVIPAALLYLTHLLPAAVRADCQKQSERLHNKLPRLLVLLVALAALWLLLFAFGIGYLVWKVI